MVFGLLAGLGVGVVFPVPGCKPTTEEICENCNFPNAVYGCYNQFHNFKGVICSSGLSPQLASECALEYNILSGAYATEFACEIVASATDEGGDDGADGADGADETAAPMCAGWDPDAEVTYDVGVYFVDSDLIRDLVVDPKPLLECDGARFEPAGTGYEVVGASSGTLIYALGLRNGDIVLEINGLPLGSGEDAATALGDLYFDAQETEYSLDFMRGTVSLTHDYELQ